MNATRRRARRQGRNRLAIEIENTASARGHDLLVAANTFLTSGVISESATAPTSRTSSSPRRPKGGADPRAGIQEAAGGGKDVLLHYRSGAACPVRGMSKLEAQHSSENRIISVANFVGSPPSLAARPPTMVPSRMAMKVAPSTSAFPGGSSERSR